MGRKDKSEEWLNDLTYLQYFNQLENLALSLFEWKGLPDSVNKRWLELSMLRYGSVVWYIDPKYGLMAMPQTSGQLNFMNDPIETKAWGTNYYYPLGPNDDWVIMWNNFARKPIYPMLELFAQRLMETQRTIDVNINAQKTPWIVAVEQSQLITFKNVMSQMENNALTIYGDKKGFDPENIRVFNIQAPYVAGDLTDYKHDLWNEIMTYFGIGNANQDKKERLVADEVSANDEQVEASRNAMLQARQEACEQVNQLFGTSISVDYKIQQEEESEGDSQDGDGEEA